MLVACHCRSHVASPPGLAWEGTFFRYRANVAPGRFLGSDPRLFCMESLGASGMRPATPLSGMHSGRLPSAGCGDHGVDMGGLRRSDRHCGGGWTQRCEPHLGMRFTDAIHRCDSLIREVRWRRSGRDPFPAARQKAAQPRGEERALRPECAAQHRSTDMACLTGGERGVGASVERRPEAHAKHRCADGTASTFKARLSQQDWHPLLGGRGRDAELHPLDTRSADRAQR